MVARIKQVYILIAVFVIGVALGYFVTPSKTETVFQDKPVIQEKVVYQKETEIQYVQKEGKNDADVELNSKSPDIKVKVNGQEHGFQKIEGETQKFENGKLVVNETTELKLDIKYPVPNHSIGMGYSNHGVAILADTKLKNNVSAWTYGDKETIAGGIKVSF